MTGFIPAPIKPEITMDHLEKVDIRAGLIKRVEFVPVDYAVTLARCWAVDRIRTRASETG